MTTTDFITELFCRIDDQMKNVKKHSQASLYPSELVTLGLLQALKGVGNRAFYHWLSKDYQALFPKLPERTRLSVGLGSQRMCMTRAFILSLNFLKPTVSFSAIPVFILPAATRKTSSAANAVIGTIEC